MWVGIQAHDWHAHVLSHQLANQFDHLELVSYLEVEVLNDLEVALVVVDDVQELKKPHH